MLNISYERTKWHFQSAAGSVISVAYERSVSSLRPCMQSVRSDQEETQDNSKGGRGSKRREL